MLQEERRVADTRTMVIGAIIIALTSFTTYLGTRLHATYQVATEIGRLDAKFAAHVQAQAGRDKAIEDLLTQLSLTIWTKPGQTAPDRRPSAVELWQINRDAELQKRLRALEQWRFRAEAPDR